MCGAVRGALVYYIYIIHPPLCARARKLGGVTPLFRTHLTKGKSCDTIAKNGLWEVRDGQAEVQAHILFGERG